MSARMVTMISLLWVSGMLLQMGCSDSTTIPSDGSVDTDGNNNVLCERDQDCINLPGYTCQDGVCKPENSTPCECNYDCDKGAGEICDSITQTCKKSLPPINCVDTCDCFSSEICFEAQCVFVRDKIRECTPEDLSKCTEREVCKSGICVPGLCNVREDCASELCLVCKGGECTVPASFCRGESDCCVGFICNFGTCVEDETGCLKNEDCKDPEFPICGKDKKCVPECVSEIDCPLPGQVCVGNHCVTPGCKPEDCDLGQWCNLNSGKCELGCDDDEDCFEIGETCNLVTHECGKVDCCGGCVQSQYCNTLTCDCVDKCTKPEECPEGFDCKLDGKCWCTEGVCPEGTECNLNNGDCEKAPCTGQIPGECPVGMVCNPQTGVCEPGQLGDEGAACFSDSNCDQNQGLRCDNALICIGCMLMDEAFAPTFTCLYKCSMLLGVCPDNGKTYECKYRLLGYTGLCMEPEAPPNP